jgi:hypothetical protein
MMYFEYIRPTGETEGRTARFWLPDPLLFERILLVDEELVHYCELPNDHLATFRAYVTDEDAMLIVLKYGSKVEFKKVDK